MTTYYVWQLKELLNSMDDNVSINGSISIEMLVSAQELLSTIKRIHDKCIKGGDCVEKEKVI